MSDIRMFLMSAVTHLILMIKHHSVVMFICLCKTTSLQSKLLILYNCLAYGYATVNEVIHVCISTYKFFLLQTLMQTFFCV